MLKIMESFKTDRTQTSRDAHQSSHDQETIYSILDEAMHCIISYSRDDQPFAIPTGYVRIDNHLFIHGSVKSHFLTRLTPDAPVCISVSMMDGLVLAKAAFSHSFNYRSVTVFSTPYIVEEEEKKLDVLKAFTEKMMPGRWEDIRKPTPGELKATQIVGFEIKEASAKQRSGPPNANSSDRSLPVWTGVIPLKKGFESPEPHSGDTPSISIPSYIEDLYRS